MSNLLILLLKVAAQDKTNMWSGRCSPHDTANPILIGKLYMSPPYLLPSGSVPLCCLGALWDRIDLNTLFKSLLFVDLVMFWMWLPPRLRDKPPRYELQNGKFYVSEVQR